MGKTKLIWDVQREYSNDFTVINDSLLLCKFCDSIVNWRKKSRVQEHMNTKMHQDRKEAKLMLWMEAAAAEEAENDDDDWEEDDLEGERQQPHPHHQRRQEGPSTDGQQYCLRWNNHQNNLLRVFTRLLGAEQFTDVLLAAEGRTIRAHKVVLSACSSYFETLFLEFDEKNQIVILRDTSYADISAIVEFMYKGEINVAQNQLASLLKTAESLKVKGLAEVSTNTDGNNSCDQKTPKHSSVPPTSSGSGGSISNHFMGNSQQSGESVNGDSMKRKRGRPRLLDSPGDLEGAFFPPNGDHSHSSGKMSLHHPSSTLSSSTPATKIGDVSSSSHASTSGDVAAGDFPPWASDTPMFATMGDEPTPGGPLTEERIGTLGIVKMNDYVKTGTRQQFWEEYYVRVVMQAVRNKEIDMKGGAELLGVSYGTLYGRYRELFGYVKHAWNVAGRPMKVSSFPTSTFWTDPNNHQVLEQLKDGKINIKQAANLMGIDAAVLAYQLSGRLSDECPSPFKLLRFGGDRNEDDDDEDEDYQDDPRHYQDHEDQDRVSIRPIRSERRRREDDEEEGVDPMDQK